MSQVNVHFCLSGDEFSPDEITKTLSLQPTRIYNKGDFIRDLNINRKNSSWEYSIEDKQTVSAENTLSKVVNLFYSRRDKVLSAISQYDLSATFLMAIYLMEGQSAPSLVLNRHLLKKIVELGADIDMDLYVID